MFYALRYNMRICAFDVTNKYGQRDFELIEPLKRAATNDELICEECGEPVSFRCGDVYVPHFAHRKNSDCVMSSHKHFESEAHKRGVFGLYQFFMRFCDTGSVHIDHKLQNGRRANLYIQHPDGGLAVEYVCKPGKLKDWYSKLDDYKSYGIQSVWILDANESRVLYKKTPDFFERLIQENADGNPIILMDSDKEEMIFLKYMEYRDEEGLLVETKSFSQKYPLLNVHFDTDSLKFCTDFDEKYSASCEAFIKSVDIKVELKRQDELKKAEQQTAIQIKLEAMRKVAETISPVFIEPLPAYEESKRPVYIPHHQIPQEMLKQQALEAKEKNPQGPWYDITGGDAWGICSECGDLTNQWWFYFVNTCKCNKCK